MRSLAQELKVDLKKVKATGKGGRITKDDVIKFAEASKAAPAPAPAKEIPMAKQAPPAPTGEDKLIKLTGIRRAMVKSMTDALTIPPYNLQEIISIEKLKLVRKAYLDANPKSKVTFLPFFAKAFSQAMLEFPIFNALTNPTTDKEGYIFEYIEKADHNLSFAVDSPAGLLVPNVKAVQTKSILQINDDLKGLIDRARKGTLSQADLSDGTFTLSNIGNLNGLTGVPVIFRPQVAIAAMGRTRLEPEFTKLPNGEYNVTAKEVINITLTCDHRIIDGATGTRFISLVKNYIENIDTLLMTLK